MLWNLHIYIYMPLYYYDFQRFGTKYDHAHFTVFIYEHYIGCFFFFSPTPAWPKSAGQRSASFASYSACRGGLTVDGGS